MLSFRKHIENTSTSVDAMPSLYDRITDILHSTILSDAATVLAKSVSSQEAFKIGRDGDDSTHANAHTIRS